LRSPFFDLQYGGLDLKDRFQTYEALWAQVGLYVAKRYRVALRVGAPREATRDDGSDAVPTGYTGEPTGGRDAPALFANATAGLVISEDGAFMMAPSLSFLLTDQSRYGYGTGVMLPFVWVTRRGFRIGFEASALVTFGGSIRGVCTATDPSVCDSAEVRDFPRGQSSGFSLSFLVGYGMLPSSGE
jgi:hypothetical protein